MSPAFDRQASWSGSLGFAPQRGSEISTGHSSVLHSSRQGRRNMRLGGKGNGKQMGLMVNFNDDSLLALTPLEQKGTQKEIHNPHPRLTYKWGHDSNCGYMSQEDAEGGLCRVVSAAASAGGSYIVLI